MIPTYDKKKTHFSENQWQAIYKSGKNLLVSASAGSGKTSVLVERVIQKIIRGTNVNELLIVTFTEAAASEMKARIKCAIEKKLAEDVLSSEMSEHFLQQLKDLPLANISTFHAFCLTMIRRFFHLVPMDPSFRLQTDETGIQLGKEEVWNCLAEKFLLSESSERFQALLSQFSTDKSDEGLRELVFRLVEFARVDPEPLRWIQSLPDIYECSENGSDSSVYQEFVKPQLLSMVEASLAEYQRLLPQAERTGNAKFMQLVEEKIQWIVGVQRFLEEDQLESWDVQRKVLVFPPFRFGKKEENVEEVLALKPLWEAARENLKRIASYEYQLGKESYHWKVLRQAREGMADLVEVTLAFYHAYQQQKEVEHLLDFSDLEHFALQILQTKNTSECLEAQEYYRQRFSEVLIDEYQDVNRLQVEILSKVSRGENQFMVGDVKQSIYGFRLADPMLFMNRYACFQRKENGELLILAENYRSRKEVLDFINLIFFQLMDEEVGQILYDEQAKLTAGKHTFPDSDAFLPEILLYEQEEALPEEEIESEARFSRVEGEIHLTAQKIRELMESSFEIWDDKKGAFRPIVYSDIVILTSTKSENLSIQEILTHYGIPNHVTDANTYFQTTEIQIMMSLLQIIDNPYQDIPLASVLRSPIVGLSEPELAEIRVLAPQKTFYEAVKLAAEKHPKVTTFLAQLTDWRNCARKISLADLIGNIYEKSAYVDFVGGQRNGRIRQANLYALVERAVQFEEEGFRGLFQFVRFIQKMQEKKKDLAESSLATSENVVEIMTIHKSKGLEFPVVFVIHLSKKFNFRELSQGTVLDEQLGVGVRWLDVESRFTYETLPFLMIQQAKKRKLLSEEYRKFYVAFTRAEQKLFLVGSVDNWETSMKKWVSGANSEAVVLSKTVRQGTLNFMDLLMMTLVRHPNGQELAAGEEVARCSEVSSHAAQFSICRMTARQVVEKGVCLRAAERETLQTGEESIQEYAEELRRAKKRLEFCYPYQAATQTASYQSVSEIKRMVEELEERERFQPVASLSAGSRQVTQTLAMPRFLSSSESQNVTQAMVGSAMHLLLQNVDLSKQPTSEVFSNLLQMFVERGILSPLVAEKVRIHHLVRFFDTSFGQLLLANSENVYREEAFSMLVSPRKIYGESSEFGNEKVLIHGIVDGYLDFGEEVWLFDYKTDFVSSTPTPQEIEALKQRYQGQMKLYQLALERALQKKVTSSKLVLLSAGRVEEIA